MIATLTPNACISWWLMASYVYYDLGRNLMSDQQFDALTLRIKDEWDFIDHPHKHLIKDTNLEAGSGFDIKYPSITKYSAAELL